jgi:hypothetical protein
MNTRSMFRLAAVLAIAALPACAADSAPTVVAAAQPAPAATAEAGPQSPGMHRHHHMRGHHHGGRMGAMMAPEHIEGRLAFLKTELKITEPQTAQWNAFADFLRERTKQAQARHAGHHARHQEQGPGGAPHRETRSLPDRLDNAVKMMEQRLAEMRRFKAAVAPLYGVLNESQRKAADQLLGRG